MAYLTGLDKPEHARRVIWMGHWARPKAFGVPGPESSKETLSQATKRLIAHASDPLSDGYSPHSYRHLAEQLAKHHGHYWLDKNPAEAGRLDDGVLADALLDHAWGESDLLGYNDLEPNREKYSGYATHGIWELVRTDRGARTAPDWQRREATQAARGEASEAVEECMSRVADLKTSRRKFTDDLDLLNDQQSDNYSDTKLIRKLLTISSGLDDAYEQLHRANQELGRAEQELHDALAARIPIRDELSEAQHRALQTGPLPVADEVDPADLPPVRNWLSCREVAEAWGKSPQTAKNWFNGLQNPPFDPAIAVEEPAPRKRRINVDTLDLSKIDPDVSSVHPTHPRPTTREETVA